MRKLLIVAILAILAVAASNGWSQTLDDSKPASTNISGAQYPRVTPDGRVIFRVEAPNARKVQIKPANGHLVLNNGYNGLGKAPYDMTRDEDGVWTVTTPPVTPGFHTYTVLIDGTEFTDPSSETFVDGTKPFSCVEVPEPGVDFYLIKDVPHGQVRLLWVYSKLTEKWRLQFVYTPPGYDAHPQQRYPVLYLRYSAEESNEISMSWIRQGHANFILDNLIAAGKAKPMIVVMDNGAPHEPTQPSDPASKIRPVPERPMLAAVIVKEVIPAIDANFRTIADRDHRAMAGLSGGSIQTLSTTMHNLDIFGAIGVFSRPPIDNFDVSTIYGGAMSDADAFNKKVHLFWWGVGTEEVPGIYNSLKKTRASLDKAGIQYTYVEYPGLSHEWQVWRKMLNDFAPMLFRW